MKTKILAILALMFLCPAAVFADDAKSLWPPVTTEAKPGAYWWWPGSAVDEAGIRWNIAQAAANNMGTLHIIPIYGVQGNDANEIPYLTPKWLAAMQSAINAGKLHGMNIDMTLGTGWCFGGPEVADEDSATLASFKRNDAGTTDVSLRRKACMVKRSAPGGVGPMLDPFSLRAMEHYLAWFDNHLADYAGPMPRAVYHDSYEYSADWSDALYSTFENLHGYRLQDHLDVFLFRGGDDDPAADRVRRVKADYRRTLAEMHLAFTQRWAAWSRAHGLLTRNEAHGSPCNWLDIYAAVDIPETEYDFKRTGRDPLVSKFASSAAHVAGKKLVASESGTWAEEHFHERLGTLKVLFDGFFLAGVNHLFYHGMIYSPENAAWPGWSFYASTQMNPRNPQWRDAKHFNEYITRVQSVMQAGRADNDILLLWTVDEPWHRADRTVHNFSVHNAHNTMLHGAAGVLARKLWDAGLTFDYISPRQLEMLKVENGRIIAPGGEYQILLIAKEPYMEPSLMQRLNALSEEGAAVCFDAELPKDVPGFARLDERRRQLEELKKNAPAPIPPALFDHLRAKLGMTPSPETPYLGSTDMKAISRRLDDGRFYFVSNVPGDFEYEPNMPGGAIDRYFRLAKPTAEIVLLDPMTGSVGKAQWRTDRESGLPEVRLQLRPNQSLILRTFDAPVAGEIAAWHYADENRRPITLPGPWKIEFLTGGPTLPAPLAMDTLASWTEHGADYEHFSGTACYTTTFDSPTQPNANATCRLNLGDVRASARVRLNGHDLGCVFCWPMIVDFPASLLKAEGNTLEIEVTNLAANRIRWMDMEGIPWKIFNDINIVNISYKPFDAAEWPIQPSGLLGPVTVTLE